MDKQLPICIKCKHRQFFIDTYHCRLELLSENTIDPVLGEITHKSVYEKCEKVNYNFQCKNFKASNFFQDLYIAYSIDRVFDWDY